MTIAVCFKCGQKKIGAFLPCPNCGKVPKTDEELAVSLAMTDHYFDKADLDKMSEATRRNGKAPELSRETQQQMVEAIRRLRPMLPDMIKQDSATDRRPWWKLW